MRIAITRLKGKEGDDHARCARRGHECFTVSPLRSEPDPEQTELFDEEVKKKALDCIFYTSALPAYMTGPY